MNNRLLLSLASLALLGACSRSPSTDASTSAVPAGAAPASRTAPRIAAVGDSRIHVEPAVLETCNAQVVRVVWDMEKDADAGSMQIWVGPANARKLFAAGGNAGTVATGAWTRPGEEFELRKANHPDAVARAIVGGPRCD